MRTSLFAFAAILLSFTLSACVTASSSLKERTQLHMETVFSLSLPENSRLHGQAFALVKEIEEKLSADNKTSEISKLNRLRQAKISPLTANALRASIFWSKKINSYFGPKIHTQRKHTKSKATRDPAPFHQSLHIINNKAYLKQPSLKVDLSDLSKGFAIDQVRNFLEKEGIHDFLIKIGSDIYCKKNCRFFIPAPSLQAKKIGPFQSENNGLSLSTTENSERFPDFVSVTIFKNNDNTGASALATAASVMSLHHATTFLKKTDCAYLFILADGKVITSDNLKQFTGLPSHLVSRARK